MVIRVRTSPWKRLVAMATTTAVLSALTMMLLVLGARLSVYKSVEGVMGPIYEFSPSLFFIFSILLLIVAVPLWFLLERKTLALLRAHIAIGQSAVPDTISAQFAETAQMLGPSAADATTDLVVAVGAGLPAHLHEGFHYATST